MSLMGVLLDAIYLLFGTDMYVFRAPDGLGNDGQITRHLYSADHA